VNVPDQSHARYLEGQVAWYTWKVVLDILWFLLLL
ncbi:structural maintenance-like chromosomes protein, partial [Trifolium medium]|nr:structural maintenance-like chromosomes protein [Trifolium medium]